jgi:tetratricopeptide (TPR) repeat protein
MGTRKLFNALYFIGALLAFAWMLRDNPHMRAIPILSMIAAGFYGLLALVSLLKPNGFAVSQAVIPMHKARCMRRLALLLPLPAMIYFGLYSACLEHAGEWRCLNKFFDPIARFEKASFSRDRMVAFVLNTHPRLLAAAERKEAERHWRTAESYYKAATRLENRLYDRKLPSSYTILACLYDRMGLHERAERLYLRAEELANDQSCNEGRICQHSEIVSIPHLLNEIKASNQLAIQPDYAWLADYASIESAPSGVLGRQFAAINTSSRHSWSHLSKCGHKCSKHKKHSYMHKCDDALKCNDEEHQFLCTQLNCDDHKAFAAAANPASCDEDCKDDSHKHGASQVSTSQLIFRYEAPTMTTSSYATP